MRENTDLYVSEEASNEMRRFIEDLVIDVTKLAASLTVMANRRTIRNYDLALAITKVLEKKLLD